ncbi:MAG TPA: fumarylacetoacetate hydrolase family protein [Devosia sp.]|nr:fumarylacetoacetate hydrolase family protein [Devosia sp.]
MVNDNFLATIAERLDDAARNATAIEQLPEAIDNLQAYDAQRLSIARRLARGEKRVGIKLGLTSKAKMAQVGVNEMIWGRLTDGMLIDDGGVLDMSGFIHPRAEPEIAFLIGKPLSGRVTSLEAFSAIDGIASAIEIIDSRFRNFKFRVTDVIADNSSSSGFVVGPWNPPATDVGNLGMALEFDGKPVAIGSSAAILGHPLRALVAAVELLSRYGEGLLPGDILLSGASTAAEPLKPNTRVRVRVEGLAGCGFTTI